MSLRVEDLSAATQSAVRTTRRLGGYVAGADYSTGSDSGDSRLALRVPVQNVQTAIARFTDLGTIVSQHISVADLQEHFDTLGVRLAIWLRPYREPASGLSPCASWRRVTAPLDPTEGLLRRHRFNPLTRFGLSLYT